MNPEFMEAKLTFCQEGNSMGTTEDTETISIELENTGDGCFFVLRTTGWSFDSIEELTSLLEHAEGICSP